MDARLDGLARSVGAIDTRYADDLTFSFGRDERHALRTVIRATKGILAEHGYRLHQTKKKLRIRRSHQRQRVCGLVVNERVNLPRETRRWLRACAHRAAAGRVVTLSPAQQAGWQSLQAMIAAQSQRRAE